MPTGFCWSIVVLRSALVAMAADHQLDELGILISAIHTFVDRLNSFTGSHSSFEIRCDAMSLGLACEQCQDNKNSTLTSVLLEDYRASAFLAFSLTTRLR